MKRRKTPMRMCLGCREMKPKRELMRVVKDREGKICIDFTGKKPGRGAYICREVSCFQKAKKGKSIEKAFETSIGEEIYDELKEQLVERDGQ